MRDDTVKLLLKSLFRPYGFVDSVQAMITTKNNQNNIDCFPAAIIVSTLFIIVCNKIFKKVFPHCAAAFIKHKEDRAA
jgi:hypothetical protein